MADKWEEGKSSGSSSLSANQFNGDAPASDGLPEAGVEAASTYSSGSEPYGEALGTPAPTVATTPVVEETTEVIPATNAQAAPAGTPPPPPPPQSSDDEDDDPEEQGMLRMSFMEHLEELRTRLIRAILGLAVAFLATMFFSKELWRIVSEPAVAALKDLGINPPQ